MGDRVEISTATVLEALQRNFGGLPASDFQQVVTAFLEHLRKACGRHKFPDPQPEQFLPTLEVLSASLEETGHTLLDQHATLSDKLARPKLIIDYTGTPPTTVHSIHGQILVADPCHMRCRATVV